MKQKNLILDGCFNCLKRKGFRCLGKNYPVNLKDLLKLKNIDDLKSKDGKKCAGCECKTWEENEFAYAEKIILS